MEPSPRFRFNWGDLEHVLLMAGLVALSAAITTLIQTIPTVDFGPYSGLIIAVVTAVLKALLQFISGPPAT